MRSSRPFLATQLKYRSYFKEEPNRKEDLMEDPLPPLALQHSLSAITSPSTAEWLWLCCEHLAQHLLVRSAGMSGGHILDSFPLLFAPSFLAPLGWGSLCPPILHLTFSAKLSVEVPWVAIILDSFLPFPKLTRWLSPPGGCAWESPLRPVTRTPDQGTRLLTSFLLSRFTSCQSLLHVFLSEQKLFQSKLPS